MKIVIILLSEEAFTQEVMLTLREILNGWTLKHTQHS